MTRGDREPLTGVVVAHGELAAALVRAVEGISGVRGALRPISNVSSTPAELRERVARALGGAPGVVFVDMASGSCAFAGHAVAGERGDVAVVTGASLPMLLDFVFHRDLTPPELARRVVGKGRSAAEAYCRSAARGARAGETDPVGDGARPEEESDPAGGGIDPVGDEGDPGRPG